MIISEKPQISDTSQRTIDPLHRARAPPPPATRASRSLAERRASSTPRVRVSAFVASASLSHPSRARLRGESRRLRGPRATDRFFWDAKSFLPERARTRAGASHDASTGARDSKRRGAKASVDVARARAVETRGAGARRRSVYGRGRRRFTGARDVGGRRRAVRDPVRRARGVREARASVRTSIASATRATRATREGGAPVI